MVDIAIAVSLCVLTLITAYLGVHVTLHPAESAREKRRYKIGFCVCGILACALIGIQTYRNDATQQELHSEITHIQKDTTRIERNTQQPPSVQVTNNIPAPTIALPNRPASDRKRNAPILEAQLRSLSNPQLRARALALAHRMAEFARNAMLQVAAYSDSTVKPDNPSPAEDKPSQTSADGIGIYNKIFLNEAVAMRAELWRRVGLVGSVHSEQAFAPLPPNADIERISDAAEYLESLADKLPN